MSPRLIIVSNRVVAPEEADSSLADEMAATVKAALKNQNGVWFGWSGKMTDQPTSEPRTLEVSKVTYVQIDLSNNDIQEYCNGLANSVLWVLFSTTALTYRNIRAAGRERLHPREPPLCGSLERVDQRGRRHLGARLSPDGSRARIAFAGPSQPDWLFPSHALCAARHLTDPAAPQGDPRRADLLRPRRIPDRKRSRQFRRLSREAEGQRRDAAATKIDWPTGPARRLFRSASKRRRTCGLARNAGQRSPMLALVRESLSGSRLVLSVDRLDCSKGYSGNRIKAFERSLWRC